MTIEREIQPTIMNPQLTLVKLTICGPGDVTKEIAIAQEIIDAWNRQHGEATGIWVKHQHWSTDSYPDLSDRAQGVINRQLIDGSKILVGIFWSRFGTPTGVADSGTEEEIRRGIQLGRKVLLYFSNLEPIPVDADTQQLEALWKFRREFQPRGLCGSFSSRAQFRKEFANHLALALNAFEPTPLRAKPTRKPRPSVSQSARTKKGNVYQNIGDTFNYAHPPANRIIRERRPGSVTTEQVHQITEWINELAEGEVGMTREAAFAMWGSRFRNHFRLGHREDLPSRKMHLAEKWYRTQKAIQKEGYKSKAPELYRNRLIGSIKAGMNEVGVTNATYYPALSKRLKMKRVITHLPDLTTLNLKRVYNAVRGDVRKFRHSSGQ